jgi:hypothetical protein
MTDRETLSKFRIKRIVVRPDLDGGRNGEIYEVGFDGVQRLEEIQIPGELSFVPYVRVWRGGKLFASFNWHKLHGVYFERSDS